MSTDNEPMSSSVEKQQYTFEDDPQWLQPSSTHVSHQPRIHHAKAATDLGVNAYGTYRDDTL